jgi:putative acyl-CoA dehydrogenase
MPASDLPAGSVPAPPPVATHEVFNQAPPFEGVNLYTSDRALVDAVHREGASWAEARLIAVGQLVGSAASIERGFLANQNPPVLVTHDRVGRRIDEVQFHPAWHDLLRQSVAHGLHSLPWAESREGSHVARAALLMIAIQNEAGHCCPISMTYSAVPVLRIEPSQARTWEPRLLSTTYDNRSLPAGEKNGVLVGMAMTEKQGGSDVRSNTSRAVATGARGPGREYALTGHKWFCSAPMCDAFLVLAQAPAGLSCFLMPRWRPDGTRNGLTLQRLKNKLGNTSNASAEIEFSSAYGVLIGEEGRGVPTIIEMVNFTRLDCTTASAALMRMAVSQAIHHARHRRAFGRLLVDQALMRNVLADLAVEAEAATALAMRLARACDRAPGSEEERVFRRVALPAAKYWVCKRASIQVGEAMECLGGNGYVEDSIVPRLYRECPLNGIWEGPGNVMCLDLVRALTKEPGGADVFFDELTSGVSGDRRLDAFVRGLRDGFPRLTGDEALARCLAERMAVALQAALLLKHAPPEVADAFCASRLSGDRGACFGTLPSGVEVDAILERSSPD